MPPYRDILGITQPVWTNAPAGFGALAITVPPPVAVVARAGAPPVHAAPVPPPRPVNQYPFDFWPPKPWDAEPDDATLGMSIKAIKSKEEPKIGEKWMDNTTTRMMTEEYGRAENFSVQVLLDVRAYGAQ
jgi:hypothetical protein